MMLMASAVLRNLVEQYETLAAPAAGDGMSDAQRQLDDVSYTLCVATGKGEIREALTAARQQISAASR